MKVILLQDVPKLGKKYDIKDVSDGYGRNFLLKNKLGEVATDPAIKRFEEMKKRNEKDKEAREEELIAKISGLSEKGLFIEAKANPEGHLFAGIKKEDVLKALKHEGINIDEGGLVLEKPIKEIGAHDIAVKIGGKNIKFKFTVNAIKE